MAARVLLAVLAPIAVFGQTRVFLGGCAQSSYYGDTISTTCAYSAVLTAYAGGTAVYTRLASQCNGFSTSSTINAFTDSMCTGTAIQTLTITNDGNFYSPAAFSGGGGLAFQANSDCGRVSVAMASNCPTTCSDCAAARVINGVYGWWCGGSGAAGTQVCAQTPGECASTPPSCVAYSLSECSTSGGPTCVTSAPTPTTCSACASGTGFWCGGSGAGSQRCVSSPSQCPSSFCYAATPSSCSTYGTNTCSYTPSNYYGALTVNDNTPLKEDATKMMQAGVAASFIISALFAAAIIAYAHSLYPSSQTYAASHMDQWKPRAGRAATIHFVGFIFLSLGLSASIASIAMPWWCVASPPPPFHPDCPFFSLLPCSSLSS